MSEFYTDQQRELQGDFETQDLANVLTAAIVTDHVPEEHAEFISSRDFFFLSTVTSGGEPTVSHKGGPPGFVKVQDEKTLLFPSYDGNGMFLSMGNISASAKIGMLFIDFERPHRVRVQATASLLTDAKTLDEFPGADIVVRADVDTVFLNCGRYIHKHDRIAPSIHVPDADGDQPLVGWKRLDLIQPFLPSRDQGLADAAGGTLTEQEHAEWLASGKI